MGTYWYTVFSSIFSCWLHVGENITAAKLKKMKVLAVKILTMNVKDDLIDTIAEHTDPSAAWAALK
jgi:predicted transcriptional regulator